MDHHTEFTCGLDLSLQSPTQVMWSPGVFLPIQFTNSSMCGFSEQNCCLKARAKYIYLIILISFAVKLEHLKHWGKRGIQELDMTLSYWKTDFSERKGTFPTSTVPYMLQAPCGKGDKRRMERGRIIPRVWWESRVCGPRFSCPISERMGKSLPSRDCHQKLR